MGWFRKREKPPAPYARVVLCMASGNRIHVQFKDEDSFHLFVARVGKSETSQIVTGQDGSTIWLKPASVESLVEQA